MVYGLSCVLVLLTWSVYLFFLKTGPDCCLAIPNYFCCVSGRLMLVFPSIFPSFVFSGPYIESSGDKLQHSESTPSLL